MIRVDSVPRAGVEPALPKELVFETSASTNSATWARCRRRTKNAILHPNWSANIEFSWNKITALIILT